MSSIAKICKGCKIEKSFSEYGVFTGRKGKKSLDPYCRECSRKRAMDWHRANPLKAAERKKTNYEKNREKECAYARQYRADNKERTAETDRAYKKANRAKLTAKQNERHERNTAATPKWLTFIDHALITEFYEVAACKRMQTGHKYHVDHIFPLKGKNFCGLNVPWNLQVIEQSKNVRKSNKPPIEFAHMFWNVR